MLIFALVSSVAQRPRHRHQALLQECHGEGGQNGRPTQTLQFANDLSWPTCAICFLYVYARVVCAYFLFSICCTREMALCTRPLCVCVGNVFLSLKIVNTNVRISAVVSAAVFAVVGTRAHIFARCRCADSLTTFVDSHCGDRGGSSQAKTCNCV